MKFDTPATTNPIDQLKVVGKPVDRIDGPLKTTGTARYAYEWHDVAPKPAYGYILGSAIPKGRIRSIDVSKAKAAPGVLAFRHCGQCRQARQRELQHRDAARGPGHPALPPGGRARRRRDLRAGSRGRSAGPRRLCSCHRRLRSRGGKGQRDDAKETCGRRRCGYGVGRLRRRVQDGASHARRELHDPRSVARHDGAARLDRRLEWGQADALDLEPDDRLDDERPRAHARHPQRSGPPDLAVHRRWLRRQAVLAR
jgi:hypothetical protein